MENKHQRDVFFSGQETISLPLEFLYSLALQRAETCTGGESGGREMAPSPAGLALHVLAIRVLWPHSARCPHCSAVKGTMNKSDPFGRIFYVLQRM